MGYKIPDQKFPTSHSPLVATFNLPAEMKFPDEQKFNSRKRLRQFIRKHGYSIKDLEVIENDRNTNVTVTLKGYTKPSK